MKYFWMYFPSSLCPSKCTLCLFVGSFTGASNTRDWVSWNLVHAPHSPNPLMGLHWLGGRETFSLLKSIVPSIVSRGKMNPPRQLVVSIASTRTWYLFWIAQVCHWDHGYDSLCQWLSRVCCQRERWKACRNPERSKKSNYLIFGLKTNFWSSRNML